ncbi:unnamed protein product, partial [Candidula unifasciata]
YLAHNKHVWPLELSTMKKWSGWHRHMLKFSRLDLLQPSVSWNTTAPWTVKACGSTVQTSLMRTEASVGVILCINFKLPMPQTRDTGWRLILEWSPSIKQ